ncbi:WD40-repeat-containing domain protein [Boletus coccyginus]|nr:WD40-repeat-containing domain protein [Boletus coccyginus]
MKYKASTSPGGTWTPFVLTLSCYTVHLYFQHGFRTKRTLSSEFRCRFLCRHDDVCCAARVFVAGVLARHWTRKMQTNYPQCRLRVGSEIIMVWGHGFNKTLANRRSKRLPGRRKPVYRTQCMSLQLNPNTLTLRNLRACTIWEDVVNEDRCVLPVLASDWYNVEKSEDEAIMIETGDSHAIYLVAFHPDERHLFSAAADGVRRWRVADGQEVGTRMGTGWTNTISVSGDCKWVVCGTFEGTTVWDAITQDKAIQTESICTVDISPDSRFSPDTGMSHEKESVAIWNILTRERLVGPLQHDGAVGSVRFSPNGERIQCHHLSDRVRVFDSHNSDQLVKINSIEFPMIGTWSHRLHGQAISSKCSLHLAAINQVFRRTHQVPTGRMAGSRCR